MANGDYAGDLSPEQAWEMLANEGGARLVDVRTVPEWQFVGLPDLSTTGREPELISWQVYPDMHVNGEFVAELETRAPDRSAPLLFLCRSGARSRSAAIAATAAGWRRAYNVAGGFEGDRDGSGRRGRSNGWKVAGLPWKQS